MVHGSQQPLPKEEDMKLTGMQVLASFNALSALARSDVPVLTAYKIAMTLKALKDEATTIDEIRVKLLDKYGKKDDNGRPIVENNGYVLADKETFDAEIKVLFDKETEYAIHPIKMDELGADIKFSPVLLMALLEAGLIMKD